MPIVVKTSKPKTLLREIKEYIDSRLITTWMYSDEDGDFTHTSTQWIRKAYLTPEIEAGVLRFSILIMDDSMSNSIYGLYYGRFSGMMLTHFSEYIDKVEIDPIDKP